MHEHAAMAAPHKTEAQRYAELKDEMMALFDAGDNVGALAKVRDLRALHATAAEAIAAPSRSSEQLMALERKLQLVVSRHERQSRQRSSALMQLLDGWIICGCCCLILYAACLGAAISFVANANEYEYTETTCTVERTVQFYSTSRPTSYHCILEVSTPEHPGRLFRLRGAARATINGYQCDEFGTGCSYEGQAPQCQGTCYLVIQDDETVGVTGATEAERMGWTVFLFCAAALSFLCLLAAVRGRQQGWDEPFAWDHPCVPKRAAASPATAQQNPNQAQQHPTQTQPREESV